MDPIVKHCHKLVKKADEKFKNVYDSRNCDKVNKFIRKLQKDSRHLSKELKKPRIHPNIHNCISNTIQSLMRQECVLKDLKKELRRTTRGVVAEVLPQKGAIEEHPEEWNKLNTSFENQHHNINRSKIFDKEKDVLHRIAEASKIIRQKHHMLKLNKETVEQSAQEFFKPIINPIEKIVAHKEKKDQLKVKEENLIKKENDINNMLQHSLIKNEKSNESFESAIDDEIPQTSSSFVMENDDEMSSYVEPVIVKEKKDHEEENLNTSRPISELIREYLRKADMKNSAFDLVTGVRKLQKGRHLGNQLIDFENNYIFINGEKYRATKGLLELIFKKFPNNNYIKPSDKELYKKILIQTSAHKKGYFFDEELRNDKKTKNFIQPMFTGQGLPHEQKRNIDYENWDDPNELVDRLRFLISSQAAENINHSNEIRTIIDELREAKIIY